jgi:hypothetical protein
VHDLNDLQQFYKNDLSQPLRRLESARKSTLAKILVLAGVLLTVNILLAFRLEGDMKALAVFSSVGSLIGFAFFAFGATTKWSEDFKSTIIPQLLARIEPGLTYSPKEKIDQALFEASRLYEMRMYHYSGEDLVSGTISGLELSFCELDITKQSTKKNDTNTTIFNGMFLIAQVDVGIDDSVWLVPHIHETLKGNLPQGKLGEMLGGLLDRLPKQSGEKVTLDDTEFMQLFGVRAEREETAHRLLTDDLRRHLIALRESTGQDVRVSFTPDQISVALSLDGNLFDPSLTKTVLSYEVVAKFFEDFTQAYGIIAAVRPVIGGAA